MSTWKWLLVGMSALTLACSDVDTPQPTPAVTPTPKPGVDDPTATLAPTDGEVSDSPSDGTPSPSQNPTEAVVTPTPDGATSAPVSPTVAPTEGASPTAPLPTAELSPSPTLVPGESPTAEPTDVATPVPTDPPAATPTPIAPTDPPPTPEMDADHDTYVAAVDCDDNNPAVHPDAIEVCNDVDDDCDGAVDDADDDVVGQDVWYLDGDGDGYGDENDVAIVSCEAPSGFVEVGGDCNDGDDAYHPGVNESCSDPRDLNCDGSVAYEDGDDDGFAACQECDDGDPAVNPSATEVCNGIDDNCDTHIDDDDAGVVDQGQWYTDDDSDGYGDSAGALMACEQPVGSVANNQDCDDSDPSLNPTTVWYQDGDGDTWGSSTFIQQCQAPNGHVRRDGDCDDSLPQVYPGAEETCDGLDNNCNDQVDEGATDAITWYEDVDGDGIGDEGSSVEACAAPTGYVLSGGDCDDEDAGSYPGAEETCDAVDNNCDGDGDVGAEGGGAACAEIDCLAILQKRPDAASGPYWIDVDGDSGGAAPFQVYCDMDNDGGGWTLVYKISEGVAADPYVLWTGGALNEADASLLNTDKSPRHYVNRIINSYWNTGGYNVDEVRVAVYKAGDEQKFVHFMGYGTDRDSWYNLNQLIDSSWVDISSEPQNFFATAGDPSYNRRFYLNRNYGGCSADNGWLVADTGSDPCLWETSYPNLRILYATGDRYQNFETGTTNGTLGRAEVMGIYVRRHERCGDGIDNDTDGQVDEAEDGVGGSTFCPAVTCQRILNADSAAESGTYWLDPDGLGAERPFLSVCDMDTDGGGWTLVYKLTAGVNVDPYTLWTTPTSETNPAVMNLDASSWQYANRIPTKFWNTGGNTINEVRVSLYDDAVQKKEMVFRAVGSDRDNWFAADRVTDSPWSDLAYGPFNVFSPAGDGSYARRWFISRSYGGCGVDAGWFVVDAASDPCGWESKYPAARILYSDTSSYVTWDTAVAAETIGRAEVMAVWVRETEICGDGVDNNGDGSIDEGQLGSSASNPALNCAEILSSCGGGAATDGAYWIDPDGEGPLPAASTWCDMDVDGGGWTAVTDVVASTLVDGVSREYLYLYNHKWYRSPVTTKAWSWSSGQEHTGIYAYYNGSSLNNFTCNGSSEKPSHGVGCSSGVGNTPKVLPIYDKNPPAAASTICQDTPNAYGGGVCQTGVMILYR